MLVSPSLRPRISSTQPETIYNRQARSCETHVSSGLISLVKLSGWLRRFSANSWSGLN